MMFNKFINQIGKVSGPAARTYRGTSQRSDTYVSADALPIATFSSLAVTTSFLMAPFFALLTAFALLLAPCNARAQDSGQSSGSGSGSGSAAVTKTSHGYRLGRADAPIQLIGFVSYTCPHCATFTIVGEPVLQIAHIPSGKVSYELRSSVRNVIDITATLMVQCGSPQKFMGNHNRIMRAQSVWLSKAGTSSAAQRARWTRSDHAAARQSLATFLGFYDLLESRGYSTIDLNKCLADQREAERLASNSIADSVKYGLRGTPSFAIGEKLLDNVHSWADLDSVLNQRMKSD